MKKNKMEMVQVVDGQMDVLDVLADIEKNGLVPARVRTVTNVPCGCGVCIDCDFGDGRKAIVSESVVSVDVARPNDNTLIVWPKPLWNR